jgi:predicted Zn-dependent peptidase
MNSTITRSQNRNIHRTRLPNGIVVLVTENPAADIISARLFLQAGSRWETRSQAGLSHLVAAVVTKGTRNYSSLEIAEQVESIGAGLGTDAAPDYFLVSIKTVSNDFAAMLALAAEVMRYPTFPAAEVELERRLTLQAIRSQTEQPFNVAMDKLRQAIYGEHPYALSGLGTEDSVPALTRDDLVQYHRQFFRPDRLVISIAGRVEVEAMIEQVQARFGDWQIPDQPLPCPASVLLTTTPSQVLTPQQSQQSIIMLGYRGPGVGGITLEAGPHSHPYATLKLLNTYLGNGLSSRLFVELREKRGLAYDVSAFYPTRLDPAYFVVYMGTAPENTLTALEGLRAEVERLAAIPLSPDELQMAKNKLLGQYALSKQTNAQLAQIFGWYEVLGLGVGFDQDFQAAIAAITPGQAQTAAQQYLSAPYLSLLGPEEWMAQVAAAAGP